jgi:hypothetical protein
VFFLKSYFFLKKTRFRCVYTSYKNIQYQINLAKTILNANQTNIWVTSNCTYQSEIRNKINKIAHDTPLTSPPYCLAKYYFMNRWPFLVILKRKWIITLGWWRYSTSDILVIFVQWVQVKQIQIQMCLYFL